MERKVNRFSRWVPIAAWGLVLATLLLGAYVGLYWYRLPQALELTYTVAENRPVRQAARFPTQTETVIFSFAMAVDSHIYAVWNAGQVPQIGPDEMWKDERLPGDIVRLRRVRR